LYQPLTSLTKAVAVALDIAGRPETDDAYALTSVRKAYRLLNGGTFQALIDRQESSAATVDYGMDWMEAYRLEVARNEAIAKQLEDVQAELLRRSEQPSSSRRSAGNEQRVRRDGGDPSPRVERTRAQIMAAFDGDAWTVHELSQITNIHLRTVQRRLKDLIADGMVQQATEGVTPVYMATRDNR
jgi:hypothetical protein